MEWNEETDVYGRADRLTSEVLTQTARRFATVRRKTGALADFDEINRLTKALYSQAYEDLRWMIRNIGREEYDRLTEEKKRREMFEDLFLIVLFDESDPITGYVLGNEVDRKRERLYEQVVSIKSHKTPEQEQGEYGDTIVYTQTDEVRKAFDKAYNLWAHMAQEYAIRSVDVARLMAFEDMGVKYVRWNAELDDKVCQTCLDWHGRKFLLHRVPAKPHWNCRCWLTPVPEKEIKENE